MHVDLAKTTTLKKDSKHCEVSKLFFHYKIRGVLETDAKIERSYSMEIINDMM